MLFTSAAATLAQKAQPSEGMTVYQTLKRFQLSGGSAAAENLVLKRDRGVMTFTAGKFYFEAPIAGKVRGAVFLGTGTFRAEVPNSNFERDHVRRMLKADVVESTFATAVLRFTDDTFDVIGRKVATEAATADAQELAAAFGLRFLKETGVNIHARAAISILNQESPGFFIAEFDKGSRGRFDLLLDPQGRIPTMTFDINAGEKGLILAYRGQLGGTDIWMAFFGEEDYRRGTVRFSDAFDLVATPLYQMQIDVREPQRVLKVEARIELQVVANGVQAIPMALSESLPEFDSMRFKRGMHLRSARMSDGTPLDAVQEDWEGGLTLYLPTARAINDRFAVVLAIEGDFMFDHPRIPECFYPLINSQWYPRHGYLNRSRFELTFLHRKQHRIASSGVRVSEEANPENKAEMITKWKMERPISLITFGVGRYERHSEMVDNKGKQLPVEFYSLPGGIMAIKEDFILAELNNCVRYFTNMFGEYPYAKFGGVFHPRGFGQGFASLVLIPNTDRASKYTYAFLAHETAHQWWGNIVAWRSYRDQWLSEGFAEYSGLLYTGLRDKPAARKDLIDDLRRSLKDPPSTELGVGKGRLADIGPIILGHRLATRESLDAYGTLIYNKGALVLRMLHFLFTDPGSGQGQPFFDMMTDFVNRHRDGWATNDTFRMVANEHFARTPIARKYGLKDLDWFFSQWVYQTALPTYRLDYKIESQPDGTYAINGTVFQENAPEDWFMVLPLVIRVGRDQVARGSVHAAGPRTSFSIKVPVAPSKVELDPDLWILSEKTSTREYR
jgi:hypothetical protein